jgi:hypothetical protein
MLKPHDARAQLEAEGFIVTVLRHGDIHTVGALRGGKIFIAQTEDLAVSFLEIRWSIEQACGIMTAPSE